MPKGNSKYLLITAYLMIAFIFIFVIGVTRNCARIPFSEKEGYSGGDTLDIAILYGPGSYYFYGDTLDGVNPRIAESFSKATSIPIKIWPVNDPAGGIANLEKGAFDVLASLPLDNNLKKNFPVSESIFLDRLVLIQLSDSSGHQTVNSSLDLSGKTVYVAPGAAAIHRLKNLSDEIGGKIEITELPDMSDELLALQVANGSIPLAMVNERVARSVAETFPNLNYDSTVSFTQFQVWVFNPSDTIAFNRFNEWYETFQSTDQYRSIVNNY